MTESAAPLGLAHARPVFLTVLLDLLGFGLVIPLLSFYAEKYSAGPVTITLLMASYSIAQFFGAPIWGQISDRYGRRPVMLASIAGTALCLAGFAAAPSLPFLFLFRALGGLFAANISTAQAVVADVTTEKDRARGMGLIGAAFGVGFSIGPWVGGELSRFGLAAPIWLAAGLSLLNLAWAYARLPETRRVGAGPAPRRTLDPRSWLVGLGHPLVGLCVLLTFCVTFAFSMMETTFGLVAEHAWKLDPVGVGRMFLLIGVVGIVIQGGAIGALVKRFGEARLVVVGLCCTVVGFSLLAASTRPEAAAFEGPARWLGCLFTATGSSLTNPSLSSLISQGVSSNEQGAILGANQSLAALARASAPTVGGLLYRDWFLGGAFAGGAFLMLSALMLAIPAVRRASGPRAS